MKKLYLYTVLLIMSVVMAGPLAEEENGYFLGREATLQFGEGVMLITDTETGEYLVSVDNQKLKETSEGKSISEAEALLKTISFCGSEYTLDHITENRNSYEIMHKRKIGSVEIIGESCFAKVNKRTGKIATFRKMPTKTLPLMDLSKENKFTKNEILRLTKKEDAKLVYAFENGLIWVTNSPNEVVIDAKTGKEVSSERLEKIKDSIKTTFGPDEVAAPTENIENMGGKSMLLTSEPGAVFHTNSLLTDAPADEAYDWIEIWDSNSVHHYDNINTVSEAEDLFDDHEVIHFWGHGNDGSIMLYDGWWSDTYFYDYDVPGTSTTVLFVAQTCNAGEDFVPELARQGVDCAIGSDDFVSDWAGGCQTWSNNFWYYMQSGNYDADYANSVANTYGYDCELYVQSEESVDDCEDLYI